MQLKNEAVTLCFRLWKLAKRQNGPDLVDLALIAALVFFCAVACLSPLASAIGAAFNTLLSNLGSYNFVS
jgi:hypothetical protein